MTLLTILAFLLGWPLLLLAAVFLLPAYLVARHCLPSVVPSLGFRRRILDLVSLLPFNCLPKFLHLALLSSPLSKLPHALSCDSSLPAQLLLSRLLCPLLLMFSCFHRSFLCCFEVSLLSQLFCSLFLIWSCFRSPDLCTRPRKNVV